MKEIRKITLGDHNEYSVVEVTEKVLETGDIQFHRLKLEKLQSERDQHLASAVKSREQLEAMIAANIARVELEISEQEQLIQTIEAQENAGA